MSERTEGRILLVDDERLARFAISALLKTSRFEVTAVESSEKGIAELKARPYDLVLSDVMMGTMDGFAFREAVRGFNAHIPIVFLTALVHSPTNQLQERIAADAHSSYVPKNARRDVLLARIRQAVSGYRAEREAAELKAALRADLEVAAHVQSALLPPPVALGPKLFYSALSCPHDIVTGDFCHWKKLTDEAGVLVFGDISGHGTSAALAMAAVVSHLKGLAASEGVRQRRPHLICRDLDRFIRQNLRDVCYLSGTVLFADFGAKKVRYLNAGGPEPLCFARSDASRIELNPGRRGGLPMGLMDGATYDEADVVEASFPSDALFCLHSDGYSDLSTDAAGEERLPPEMLSDIIAELVRGASGTLDLASLPYRLNALLRDMGYVHAHDDRHFLVAGRSMAGGVRFLRAVPMDDPAEIDRAVEDAARWAAARKCPEAVVARLELLLGEHLANVRGHALTEARRRSEVVALEIRPAAGDLEVCAWDRGARWEGDLSEVAPHPDLALDAQNAAFAARGRGFAILRKVARSIAYERFEGLNKYTFLLETKAGGGGDDMLAPRAHGRVALVATGTPADTAHGRVALVATENGANTAHGRVALVATGNGADAAATSAALPSAALPRAALPQLPQRRHPSRNSVMTHLDNRAIMLYVTVVTGKRNAMLADKAVQDCIVAAWKAAADWLVGRYVIMPDHIHFFCAPATYPPPDFHRWMKQWKAQVSRSFPIGLRAGGVHGRVALVATGNGADAAHGRVALVATGTPADMSHGRVALVATGNGADAAHGRVALVATETPADTAHGRVALVETGTLADMSHGRVALVATGKGADAALPPTDDAAATSAALPNVPLSRPPPLFQRDCWDRQLRTGESYAQKWEYVRNNPVRKGLVAHADEWPYQGQVNVLEWHERT